MKKPNEFFIQRIMIIKSKIPKNKTVSKIYIFGTSVPVCFRSWFQFQFSQIKGTQNLIYSCFSYSLYVKA